MSSRLIMFLAFVTLMANLLCLMIDGAWLGAEDLTLMNYMTGYNSWTSGFIPIISPFIGFITHGFWKMVTWDYSFLNGGLQIIGWVLNAISVGAIFAMGQEFRGTITSLFGRR